jgi:hypothetical protein
MILVSDGTTAWPNSKSLLTPATEHAIQQVIETSTQKSSQTNRQASKQEEMQKSHSKHGSKREVTDTAQCVPVASCSAFVTAIPHDPTPKVL